MGRKYNFKKVAVTLEGEEWIEGDSLVLLNKSFASILSTKSTENYTKFVPIAMELYKSGVLTLDKADRQLLKDVLKSDRTTIDIIKYQLDDILDNPEDEEADKE